MIASLPFFPFFKQYILFGLDPCEPIQDVRLHGPYTHPPALPLLVEDRRAACRRCSSFRVIRSCTNSKSSWCFFLSSDYIPAEALLPVIHTDEGKQTHDEKAAEGSDENLYQCRVQSHLRPFGENGSGCRAPYSCFQMPVA